MHHDPWYLSYHGLRLLYTYIAIFLTFSPVSVASSLDANVLRSENRRAYEDEAFEFMKTLDPIFPTRSTTLTNRFDTDATSSYSLSHRASVSRERKALDDSLELVNDNSSDDYGQVGCPSMEQLSAKMPRYPFSLLLPQSSPHDVLNHYAVNSCRLEEAEVVEHCSASAFDPNLEHQSSQSALNKPPRCSPYWSNLSSENVRCAMVNVYRRFSQNTRASARRHLRTRCRSNTEADLLSNDENRIRSACRQLDMSTTGNCIFSAKEKQAIREVLEGKMGIQPATSRNVICLGIQDLPDEDKIHYAQNGINDKETYEHLASRMLKSYHSYHRADTRKRYHAKRHGPR